MKRYFLQFDFYDDRINKYWFGIVQIDLSEISLIEYCRETIRKRFDPKEVDADSVTIKVNAFNNIDA